MRHYRFIDLAKSAGTGSQRNPVTPLTTVSKGPPLLTAITGHRRYMASIGTIPKCSLAGVYSSAVARRRKFTFTSFEHDFRRKAQSSICNE